MTADINIFSMCQFWDEESNVTAITSLTYNIVIVLIATANDFSIFKYIVETFHKEPKFTMWTALEYCTIKIKPDCSSFRKQGIFRAFSLLAAALRWFLAQVTGGETK